MNAQALVVLDMTSRQELSDRFFVIRFRWIRQDTGKLLDDAAYLCGHRKLGVAIFQSLDIKSVRRFETKSAAKSGTKLAVIARFLDRKMRFDPVGNRVVYWSWPDLIPVETVLEIVEVTDGLFPVERIVESTAPILDILSGLHD